MKRLLPFEIPGCASIPTVQNHLTADSLGLNTRSSSFVFRDDYVAFFDGAISHRLASIPHASSIENKLQAVRSKTRPSRLEINSAWREVTTAILPQKKNSFDHVRKIKPTEASLEQKKQMVKASFNQPVTFAVSFTAQALHKFKVPQKSVSFSIYFLPY